MVKLTTLFWASFAPPPSVTLDASMVKVQVSPPISVFPVAMVKPVPLAGYVSGTAPDWVHCRAKAPLVSVTASLKVAARSVAAATPVAPSVGEVDTTVGGGFGAGKLWLLLQAPKVCVADARQVKLA